MVTIRDQRPEIELIKSFEGILDGDPSTVNLDPYLCPAGYWTIGWGHAVLSPSGNMMHGKDNEHRARAIYPDGITKYEAEVLLIDDVRRFSTGVKNALKVTLNSNQFGALVSLAYNIGMMAFRGSTLLRLANQGEFHMVPDQFMRWTKSKGRELAGLKRRRQAEVALWGKTP